jgi:hypothetical protein
MSDPSQYDQDIIGIKPASRFVVGMITDWRGQPYELTAIEPYQRRDGWGTFLLIWRSKCIACGVPFETKTSQRRLKHPTRRCAACRPPSTT